ncbi:MAG TPA: sigma 54-interacting transcriptional regulator [Kofleriaceae bacterium]|nr:sigma 54-interacting transcriptional regulator [Kofleriaceae bacterium]
MAPPAQGVPWDPSSTEALEREPAEGELLLLDRFALVVTDGPDRGALAMSPGARMTIGTDTTCDFRLTDRAMSRFHCEIELEPDGIAIRDMGSTNGTRVDGVRVKSAYLRRGARLELGRNQIGFEVTAEQIGVDLFAGDRWGSVRGRSPAMRAVFARLARAADSDITVLVTGETGTGKDLVAESIHQESKRRGAPFVVVDCAGLPRGVLESELFGHARGAFTGAARDRVGAIEAASGGTLFIDEIGELPLDLQPVLLRALERREVTRIGETKSRAVDVRVVAATHRDLRREVNAGRFRSDLYYRLAVLTVELPPLRARRDDLPLLVDELIAQVAGDDVDAAERLRRRVSVDDLTRHDWPGNVRELRNHIETAAVVERPTPGGDGAAQWFGMPAPGASQPMRVAREHWVRWFERQYIEDLMKRHGDSVAAAARAAEVDRAYIYRLLHRFGGRR